MIPFILNVERASFHQLIDYEFLSFCSSKNCTHRAHYDTEEKALALFMLIDMCCFRFNTFGLQNAKPLGVGICNSYCFQDFTNDFVNVAKEKFDEWLSKDSHSEHIIAFGEPQYSDASNQPIAWLWR